MFRVKRSEDPDAPDPNNMAEMTDREFEEYYDKNNWMQYSQEAELDDA